MDFYEVTGNLFDTESYTDKDVVLAHCIASDFGMYGGIATQFIQHFDMKNKLLSWSDATGISVSIQTAFTAYHSKYRIFTRPSLIGKAVKIDNVYNLITKEMTSDRPTLNSLRKSLVSLRKQMLHNNDKVLAIPDMIGCGIDGLDRNDVLDAICEVFNKTDITIYAVKLEQ